MSKVLPLRTIDAPPKPFILIKTQKKESPFQKSKHIQQRYARSLRGVAREVGKLVKGYNPRNLVDAERLRRALRQYSEIITPWAQHISGGILKSVDGQDQYAWREHAKKMSKGIRKEILSAPMQETLEDLLRGQVELIKSIPLEAAERVHNLVTENIYQGARAEEIAEKIFNTEKVAMNRAALIARTEVSRAATVLTQVRAEYVGSTHYRWRIADNNARPSHKAMNGKLVEWSNPPTLDKMVGHCGQFPNCRCYPEILLPEGGL